MLSLTPLSQETKVSAELFNLSVGIAIVLMLIGSAPRKWLPYCTNYLLKTISFFVLLLVIGLCISFIKPELNSMMGLFAATFIGSAPNMAAVGVGLAIPSDLLLAAQTADIVICGIYFVLLITLKEKIFIFLKSKKIDDSVETTEVLYSGNIWWILTSLLVVLGLSLGISKLFQEQQLAILIAMTIFSVTLAFFIPEEKVAKSYLWGERIFLIFCFLLGTKLNFAGFANLGVETILYGFGYLIVSLGIAISIARIFKIDREQFLILTSAGIFSPAMIGPLVSMVKRKDLFGPGMAAASLGLALGNFLGIALVRIYQFLN